MVNQIVSVLDFCDSYGEYYAQRIEACRLARNLFVSCNNRSEIARQLGFPSRTINYWCNGELNPVGLKQLNFLVDKGLLPLNDENNESFELFVELFSFVFGDGHLSKDLGHVYFVGELNNLKILKNKINEIWGLETKLSIHKSKSVIKRLDKNGNLKIKTVCGVGNRLTIKSSAISRLLYLAGAPKGNKVSQRFLIPSWVIESNLRVKRKFLGVLFGNELGCPKLRAKNAFSCAQFALHKVDKYEKNILAFMDQVKNLLGEFGINSSKTMFEKGMTIRIDGSKSSKCYFNIDSESSNILKLYKEIPFLHANNKQKRFDWCVEKFLDKTQKFEKDWEIYDAVQQLHGCGLGRRKIFKKLNLPKNYFYKINAWIHYGNRPKHYAARGITCELKTAKGML